MRQRRSNLLKKVIEDLSITDIYQLAVLEYRKKDMHRRIVSGIVVIFLLASMFTLACDIKPATANGTVHIRADGSVDPPTAPIQRNGNFYTLTGNISTSADGIVIERNNMTLDGAGYTIHGAASGIGIYIYERNNVTVKNTKINTFTQGIWLANSSNINVRKNNITGSSSRFGIYLSGSSGNNIYQNTIQHLNYSIYLYGTGNNNNVISENTMTGNSDNGIWIKGRSRYNLLYKNRISNCLLYGIFVRESASDNTVSQNNITTIIQGDGIKMLNAYNNSIIGNNVGESAIGITIESSSNNTLRNNKIAENEVNFAVYGDGLSQFLHDIDTSNMVNGKPIYYLINRQGLVINPQSYPNIGYLALVNSTNISVQRLNMTNNNGQGILFVNTRNSSIQNATAEGNQDGISMQWSQNNNLVENNLINNSYAGIHLRSSNNNTLSSNYEEGGNYGFILEGSNKTKILRNRIANASNGIYSSSSSDNDIVENRIRNSWEGIRLKNSVNNRIYHNNFISNTRQVFVWFSPINVWDNGYPSGGNYWSDYVGVDSNGDGIGETPYIINTDNQDNYPFVYFFKPAPWDQHDIGITRIFASKTVIGQGYSLRINVTVFNYGMSTENFNVSIYANTTIIQKQTVTLMSKTPTTITFLWSTIGFAKGNCRISATADTVLGEKDTEDNTLVGNWILITQVGDLGGGLPPAFFQCDKKVDGKDLSLFLQCFKGAAPPEAMYLGDLGGGVPPEFYQCDGKVDSKDLALFLLCFKGLGP
jgi:parallel beta-helix repeat protein